MAQLLKAEVPRVLGEVTEVAADEIDPVRGNVRLCRNYDPREIGNLRRRLGSVNADLIDHAGDAMDAAWWTAQWGARDVDLILPQPSGGSGQSAPYDPGDPPGGDNVIIGGGGLVAEGGGSGDGVTPVPGPDRAITFGVVIPEALTDERAFNATVTAYNPDGSVATTYTGAVVVKLNSSSAAIAAETTLTQNTAPAAVVWVAGVATISCTINAPDRQLDAMSGCFVTVRAISGAAGRGPIMGISNAGFLEAAGHLHVALSETAVEVGDNFTLTVTYRDADGTVDATYAATVNVTDGSGNVSLEDVATGLPFTGFAPGDFAAGTATRNVRFAGAVTANEDVTITATEA